MVKITTKEEAFSAARNLMKFASHPIMGDEIEQAIYDGRWLINAANEPDESECLERFIASYNRVVELKS
jgi:hypothetical protein